MEEKRLNLLITGVASGIGRSTAEYFADSGCRVFGVDKSIVESRGNITGFCADITNEKELLQIREELEVEEIRLDAIISVAGIHDMVSLVETDYGRMKRLIEVNLLGAMLAVGCFHPLLSERGRVVIVTSEVATYTPMPFNGLYNISKTALDCYADSLRQELNLLGQAVIVIRPGAVKTPLSVGSSTSTEELASSTELYKLQAGRFSELVARFTGTPIAPERIAEMIYKATVTKKPRLAYSKNRNPGLVLLSILPKRIQLFIIKALLNRKKKYDQL